jgi:hypothetical protein
VQKISGLGLEVGKALADVSEQLTQEVKVLAMVREAVVLKSQRGASRNGNHWRPPATRNWRALLLGL